MKHRKKWIGAIILSAVVLCGFLAIKEQFKTPGFMAPMQVYYATEKNREGAIALSCFFSRGHEPFTLDDIQKVAWRDYEGHEKVEILDFEAQISGTDTKYPHYGIILKIIAKEEGIFEPKSVEITLKNGKTALYHIGDWHFDIGKEEEEGAVEEQSVIELWESPVATESSDSFPYQYQLKDPAFKMCKIQTGKNEIYETTEETGQIPLAGSEPVKYIRAKISVLRDNAEYVFYGKGCYCGAMNISEEEIESMKQRPGTWIR